ncbi:N-acetylmuramoyl-L-alanine amidase [Collimonas sp. PA-H2]|uniref:peptidoglycan recognition protein family protein n=1 Tax=Collimonas sp. PA-H2 TaxID=1881062 RepID=UPI000BF8C23E|nr:peptidoglycan recognition family protein [Collimonas sp. PA-H2]PFH04480.1 N-acetylmuramoyl-L-alanine amidase [Collimonas sp. PA-H2]
MGTEAHYTPTQWATAFTESDYMCKPFKVVTVNDRAATRQAIIDQVQKQGVKFVERSTWDAHRHKPDSAVNDWDYQSIALHHAGNSFSCSANSVEQMQRVETIDMGSFNQISYHYAIDCQGVVYEALDIRFKGSHIEGGNTGVVGIVFLADLSVRGEAQRYGPGAWNVTVKRGVVAGLKEWIGQEKDKGAVKHDEPTEPQLAAAEALIKSLTEFFKITKLGGHREFAMTHGSSRACPGIYGMIIANQMRKAFNLAPP